jgi:hypothetical protein
MFTYPKNQHKIAAVAGDICLGCSNTKNKNKKNGHSRKMATVLRQFNKYPHRALISSGRNQIAIMTNQLVATHK